MHHDEREVNGTKVSADTEYLVEDGIVAGNIEQKYNSGNPIHKWLMKGFLSQVQNFVAMAECRTVYEAGCGEGLLTLELMERFPDLQYRGSDFSEKVISIANGNAKKQGAQVHFEVADIYGLKPELHSAELILCCEVLEHLDRPADALAVLAKLARKRMLFSVPNEPIWRVLNVSRGKYLKEWGNTPGHLNHWSPGGFRRFLETQVIVEQFSNPFPWSMALCRPRD